MAKILIVDDSETLRMKLRRDLKLGGYDVTEATDGLEGLLALEKEKNFDLLICDVNMPRMDGVLMCEKMRENPEFKNLPVLMLTTESGQETMDRGRKAGVIAWIIKPYKTENLLSAIATIISRPT